MATISTVLRNFREPTREELTRIFFSLPPDDAEFAANGTAVSKDGKDVKNGGGNGGGANEKAGANASGKNRSLAPGERGEMESNAVLSLAEEGVEDSYVRSYPFTLINRAR